MLLWLLRGAFVALMLGIAVFALSFFLSEEVERPAAGAAVAAGILLVAALVLFTDIREPAKKVDVIAALFFGLLLGLLLGWLVSLAMDPIVENAFSGITRQVKTVQLFARFAVTVVCCYITIS